MKITDDILLNGFFTKRSNFRYKNKTYKIEKCKNCNEYFFSNGTIFCSRSCAVSGDFSPSKKRYVREKISKTLTGRKRPKNEIDKIKRNCKKGEDRHKYKGYPNKKIHDKTCKECNKQFLGRQNSIFCSKSCANRYNTRRSMLNGKAVYLRTLLKTISKPQRELFKKVNALGYNAELEYSILNFSVDIAIPNKKIAIEYDGSYWHNNKKKDIWRQKKIEKKGWVFIRYIDDVPSLKIIDEDIKNAVV